MRVINFSYRGFACRIVEHPELLHLCGYVGLPEGHPWHGKDYDSIVEIGCHGGLTFAGEQPGEGEKDGLWWIGFDCAHCGDMSPGMAKIPGMEKLGGEYRDEEYVTNEIHQMVNQILGCELSNKKE